ncbi:hypothetical protein Taro_050929 [Colocasia esculenta]|uniref:Uncharacterized protein n=1 Tax=Colocasia esculenta TaxID=4460 RepID=A0A843XFL5_COLES|nr:hypothetical protein [Colocasia esculenta]
MFEGRVLDLKATCRVCGIPCEASARSRETDSGQARYWFNGLRRGVRHSWYQSKVVVMADRRDWGGGGEDPEESTQRMIERIWESLTDIRTRMDQQALVPPVTREEVPMAPVPPQPGVEVVDAYRGYLSSWVPQVLCEPGCSSGLCPGTCAVPSRSVSSDLDTLTL